MGRDNSVLIFSPFSSGSSIVEEFLQMNGINAIKCHGLEELVEDYENIENVYKTIKSFSIIIVLIRNKQDTYISSYFQDITKPEYDYYFGTEEQVLNAAVEQLYDRFKGINWPIYCYLNPDYYIGILEGIFQIKLSIEENEPYNIFPVKANNGNIVLIKTEDLSNYFIEAIQTCNVNLQDSTFYKTNYEEDKWYGEKYREFKNYVTS